MLILRWLVLIFAVISLATCGKTSTDRHEPEAPAASSAHQKTAPKAGMDEATQVASLMDPEKLATLGDRGANPRIQKITAILYVAKSTGKNPETIVAGAIREIGWENTMKGDLTAAAILRNLDILGKLGSTTPEDIDLMRRGRSPTVRTGPYVGDILSVDHIIPRAQYPLLDNVIANLELMPLRLNMEKSDRMGQRQLDLMKKLRSAGLLDAQDE